MESLILGKLEALPLLAYTVIFFGMTIEGEATLLAAIFSAYEGFLYMPYALAFACAGLIMGDIAWFLSGNTFEKLLPAKWLLRDKVVMLDAAILKRPRTIFFITKFIPYVNRLAIVRAKQVGISTSNFIQTDLAAGVLWFFVLVFLGITFSASFDLLKHYLRFAEVGLVLVIVAFIVLEHFISKVLRKKLSNL